MSLDSKQKRGSAIEMTMPFRIWCSEPNGSLGSEQRASILKLCSAVFEAAASDTGTAYYTGLNPVFFGGML